MRTAPLLLLATAVSLPAPTLAAPWLAPGDARARYAAQALADTGSLNRTTSTWPLMWDNLEERHEAPDDAAGTAHAYLAFERREQAQQGFRGTVTLSGATERRVVRGFSAGPDESAQLGVTLQWQGEHWAAGLSPSHTQNPQDNRDWRMDGSYLAATAGNWVIGAGNLDRWWGPGWQSSLILSNNARPLPAVWLNRRNAHAPQQEWLSWIGPWDVTLFAGEMESARTIPEARLIGMRFTMRPIQGLDIGFSRILQLDGKGRPGGAGTYWDAIVGQDNRQEGKANDPGNQLGAIDIRYGFQASETTTLGVYTQMVGEDEAGRLPGKKSWLFGVDATSALAGGEQQWYLEYTNTITDDLFGEPLPGVTYEHSIYQTGYRYRGRSMAASQGGDAEVATLGGWHFLPGGSQLGASITHAKLNQFGAIGNQVPDNRVDYLTPAPDQSLTQATLSYGTQILSGWLDVEAQYTDAPLMLRDGTELSQWQVSGEWRYRF